MHVSNCDSTIDLDVAQAQVQVHFLDAVAGMTLAQRLLELGDRLLRTVLLHVHAPQPVSGHTVLALHQERLHQL